MKTSSMGAELFRADGRTDKQTDMTKVIVAFRNFENAHLNDNYFRKQKHAVMQIFAPKFEIGRT
jgi:hypothetical protein